jgi:hypothetical protein
MNVSLENLTADEAAFVANYVEHWRRIADRFEANYKADYEARMDRRRFSLLSGFDPTPYKAPSNETITEWALDEVAKQRKAARVA